MNGNTQKIDWAKGRWKEMLVEQRKFMWHKDTVDKLASWLGLRPGMTAVDVGCGLGNLGYTFWPYFGKGGHYFGVDASEELVREAGEAAKEWVIEGEAKFFPGDAYKLPFSDDFADRVMCQTLLMHLDKPELALTEMIRVAKPGGQIICNEPDNLSAMLAKPYWSLPQLDTEDEVLFKRVYLISNQGRIRLGRGDNSIGTKVPAMMKKLGLIEIDARMNDRVHFVIPPYEDPSQKHLLAMIKKTQLDEHEFWMERTKEEFLAGGGNPDDYERFREISEKLKPILQQQIEEGRFAACGPSFFYAIKGRKPK